MKKGDTKNLQRDIQISLDIFRGMRMADIGKKNGLTSSRITAILMRTCERADLETFKEGLCRNGIAGARTQHPTTKHLRRNSHVFVPALLEMKKEIQKDMANAPTTMKKSVKIEIGGKGVSPWSVEKVIDIEISPNDIPDWLYDLVMKSLLRNHSAWIQGRGVITFIKRARARRGQAHQLFSTRISHE